MVYLKCRACTCIARNASHFTANGLRLLSSRLSGYQQKIDGHVLIGRCDDLRPTGSESNSKISEVEFLLVDFFPFISLALASCGRFASADHLTVYFLVCRSLRVWMAGMFANLTIFFRTTISIQRAFKLEKLEWQCGWEYKQAFSCLVASSGRL